mmetsp:Transcript_39300/g.91910  ORF Transcript_39300/g.91910 Transcript_39300/m.91910 type:complete len:278 (-) Transcript_39300:85-918(-)
MVAAALNRGEAVMVETRAHPRLRSTLLNVRQQLPSDWQVTLLHGPNNSKFVKAELASLRSVHIQLLPSREAREASKTPAHATDGYRSAGDYARRTNWYNRMLARAAFWEARAASHVLIFELDSALCPAPSLPLEAFFSYALVGAPWRRSGNASCCNSGLSLWHRASMLRLIARRGSSYAGHIDSWAARQLGGLHAAHQLGRPPTPSVGISQRFSVERIFDGGFTPFGVHAAHRFVKGPSLIELARRCPPLCAMFPDASLAPAPCRAAKVRGSRLAHW